MPSRRKPRQERARAGFPSRVPVLLVLLVLVHLTGCAHGAPTAALRRVDSPTGRTARTEAPRRARAVAPDSAPIAADTARTSAPGEDDGPPGCADGDAPAVVRTDPPHGAALGPGGAAAQAEPAVAAGRGPPAAPARLRPCGADRTTCEGGAGRRRSVLQVWRS
ncbi:hypothetical protein ACFQ78_19550 [Streptomyces sp. NPDC056519]|uniref:hypothetical protein n=1 Tax=Streptomyces sp. NPDC056519 TaxID=3345849 RepID=UPI0036839625